ncbi:MAG: hypothetical protein O7D91_11480 [Planctomycetota bacterium]|nr:hypothetical protein [Planctomycetota bacterium]
MAKRKKSKSSVSEDEIKEIREKLHGELSRDLRDYLERWGRGRFWMVVLVGAFMSFIGVNSIVLFMVRSMLNDDVKDMRGTINDARAEAMVAATVATDAAKTGVQEMRRANDTLGMLTKDINNAKEQLSEMQERIKTDRANFAEVSAALMKAIDERLAADEQLIAELAVEFGLPDAAQDLPTMRGNTLARINEAILSVEAPFDLWAHTDLTDDLEVELLEHAVRPMRYKTSLKTRGEIAKNWQIPLRIVSGRPGTLIIYTKESEQKARELLEVFRDSSSFGKIYLAQAGAPMLQHKKIMWLYSLEDQSTPADGAQNGAAD